jgi:hypothetical protein
MDGGKEMLGRGRRMRRRGMVAGAAMVHHRDMVMQQQYQQGAYDQQASYDQGAAYEAPPQGAPAYAPPPPAAAPPPPPAPVAPAADPMDVKMDELKKLGELHESGVLTDEEFAAQKQKILNS